MDNEIQALLTFDLLAAVMQLNYAFYHHATTAYMQRGKDIFQLTVTVPVFSGTISPTLMDNFIHEVVIPEEWRENFHVDADQP